MIYFDNESYTRGIHERIRASIRIIRKSRGLLSLPVKQKN